MHQMFALPSLAINSTSIPSNLHLTTIIVIPLERVRNISEMYSLIIRESMYIIVLFLYLERGYNFLLLSKIISLILHVVFPYPLRVFRVKIFYVNMQFLFFSSFILAVRYYFVTLIPKQGMPHAARIKMYL